jgi:MFS family permease
VFWAIIGGIGASLLLPAMQSLIHRNFEGTAQKKVYALVGAAAAIAAAVGPLLGGFITTFLSWRIAFLLEVVIIAVVLSRIKLVRDVAYTGSRAVDVVGSVLSVLGMGGIVLGILVWQEGGEFVLAILATGALALAGLAFWLLRRKRESKPTGEPPQVQAEIVRINTEARPLALQIALLVPLIAAFLGLINSLRMGRLPDATPSSAVEGMTLG